MSEKEDRADVYERSFAKLNGTLSRAVEELVRRRGEAARFTVRLTADKQREMLRKAIDEASQAIEANESKLKSMGGGEAHPAVRRMNETVGAVLGGPHGVPADIVLKSEIGMLRERVALLQFTLDNLADGDLVADAAYVHGFLGGRSLPGSGYYQGYPVGVSGY